LSWAGIVESAGKAKVHLGLVFEVGVQRAGADSRAEIQIVVLARWELEASLTVAVPGH